MHHLEHSLALHTCKLKNLQRLWTPFLQYAPKLVIALIIIGVFTSLATNSCYHWLITAPLALTIITIEIVINEKETGLLLLIDEERKLLRSSSASRAISTDLP